MMNETTHILNTIEYGKAVATSKLLPLVYEELRFSAAQHIKQESPGQMALV